MVELTRARGVDARVGDVQQLELGDASFDCVVAVWMLYHVPDLDRGLREIARVLVPGGRLVAVTNSERNLHELWSLIGPDAHRVLPFSAENGEAALERRFARVERRDAIGTLVFADYAAAYDYVAASITRRHLAKRLAEWEGPLHATRSVSVFVAETEA
jgi:ubiquinone/menaquinone biosynthesis C-methylase UbiE